MRGVVMYAPGDVRVEKVGSAVAMVPGLLAASDVLGTGWFAAIAAEPDRARPSPWSATARLGCWVCWRPGS
jgi:hypothetical protein